MVDYRVTTGHADNMSCQRTGPTAGTPLPLAPDSLTWQHFGNRLGGIALSLWVGSMQNMHPQLGAGVEQHSDFFGERLARVARSVYPIFGVVYDGDRAPTTAAEVRDYHRDIKGIDRHGRRYHALDPEVFYWAHAVFFKQTVLNAQVFGPGLSEDDKRRLFDEHVQWYRLYGVSERAVPADWEDFERYWDHMCRNVLEDNIATRNVLNLRDLDKPAIVAFIPDVLWPLARGPVTRALTWLTIGFYDEPVRRRLGFRWGPLSARLHRSICRALRFIHEHGLLRLDPHPRIAAGFDRASGRIPADTPVPQAPRQLMPPPERWHDPKHYNP